MNLRIFGVGFWYPVVASVRTYTTYITNCCSIMYYLETAKCFCSIFASIIQSFISFKGIWVVAYILNETHEDNSLVEIITRSLLLVLVWFSRLYKLLCHCISYLNFILRFLSQTSVLLLAFFSMSISQPLLSLMSMTKKDHADCNIMGRALGIPDSGLLVPRESMQLIDPNEPFDKLLSNRRFRQSFMEFADRYINIFLFSLLFGPCNYVFLRTAVWLGRVSVSTRKCSSSTKFQLVIMLEEFTWPAILSTCTLLPV